MSKLVPLRLAYGAEIGPCCMEDFFLFTFFSLPKSKLSGLLSCCLTVCVAWQPYFLLCSVHLPSACPRTGYPLLLVWRGAKLTSLTSAGEHLSC